MASFDATAELPAGLELGGRYKIITPISSGAMGAVYRAEDGQAGKHVALKHLTDTRHKARFEIEARLLGVLRHPRVVRVEDYFTDETGHYLVMQLVEGLNLKDVLEQWGQPGLSLAEAVEFTLQSAEALQYVHDQQIVHRDVKPQNLILSDDGVVLVDFGIARQLDEEEEDTGTVGIGTPRFMAPEVFAGGTVSPRSDVFGLAATLWTLLTGKAPVYADPTKLTEVVPEAGPELEATLRAGLEMVPERRVASVSAFAKALGSPLISSTGESLALSVERPDAPVVLMERIVRTAAGVFEAAACSIALIDRTTDELVYQSAWGAGAHEIVGVRLPPGTGIAGAVVSSGEPQAVDTRNDPRFAARIAEGTGYVPYTMIVAPLTRDDEPIGVLSLLDRRDGGQYGQVDLERAGMFAELAVTALDVAPSAFSSLGEPTRMPDP
jgi:predicted Ser/Thr protein kinase